MNETENAPELADQSDKPVDEGGRPTSGTANDAAADAAADTAADAGNGERPDSESEFDDGMSEEEYKNTVSQLLKVGVSPNFKHDVEETIRQRSGGRFFGRKAFGERIPYEIVALIILAIGLIAFLIIRSSTTGSLRYEKNTAPPKMAPGAKDVVPQPKPLEKQ